MHSVALHTRVSDPTTKICMKIDPYYQRQKCSPGILISSKVSFMRIFMGVRWRGGVKWEFRSLYLPNLHISGHIYYIVLCSPLVAFQWYRNKWPWMTLNGHFAAKCVSCSATNGLASPALGQNCSKICRATHILSATKMKPRERSFWQYKAYADIRGGLLERGVNWEWGRWKWRFSLHSFTVFRTFYIHGHTTAVRWYDCQWTWAYIKVIGLFHIKFLKNGVWYDKSYYRQLIGNHTLAFDWCHFWWPCSTFEGHFSLGCHFHVHFSYPWHAFASHGLPAIAELLVT